jgi:putative toxin-antitoxin system antitoxin component (TIGR02293 family)
MSRRLRHSTALPARLPSTRLLPTRLRGVVLEAAPARDRLPKSGDAAVFRKIHDMPALDRIRLVKSGVPARWFVRVAERMAMPKDKLYRMMGVPKATLTRKERLDLRLDMGESERALAAMALWGQVESIVAESGEPRGFDGADWTARWLERPQPALGGRRPAELMDTADGRMLVSDLVARMQSSAYA